MKQQNSIEIQSTSKHFSALGGIPISKKFINDPYWRKIIEPCLPTSRKRKLSSWDKFEAMVIGFQAGAECLDDWNYLAQDPVFSSQLRSYDATTFGNYLRSFTGHHLFKLRRALINMAYLLRRFCDDNEPLIFDVDSTLNVQYGVKMEGYSRHYNGQTSGLHSVSVFDNMGLCYWHDVRPGNTHTAKGVSAIIHEVLASIPQSRYFKKKRKIFRADSGYCNSEFMNAVSAKGCGFVCMGRMGNKLEDSLEGIKNWRPCGLTMKDGRKTEIGSTTVAGFGSTAKHVRVVAMRALREDAHQLLFDFYRYDYVYLVTNMGQHEYSNEQLFKLYRHRGQAENYIKLQKYGFDLKHYPCLKLSANKAYGLIAAFAYSIMQFMAQTRPLMKRTRNGIKRIVQFAKAHRRRWLFLPAQVVCHAGKVIIRYNERHYKEVNRWLEFLKILRLEYS